ncbi:MAG TPA: hypothetical protein H9987_10535 [Candidatus Luteococcus avicola]|nr:hypothetical protein [Candidatus Luteococcus avicola]
MTGWIKTLPGPAAAIYEAGPTGYGLARTLLSHDIRTVVAAPSKLQRRSGSRVKTDAIDAEHLSMLLLRHGIVYSGKQAWSNARDAWLKRQRFDSPLVRAAFDEAYDSVITITAAVIVSTSGSRPCPPTVPGPTPFPGWAACAGSRP